MLPGLPEEAVLRRPHVPERRPGVGRRTRAPRPCGSARPRAAHGRAACSSSAAAASNRPAASSSRGLACLLVHDAPFERTPARSLRPLSRAVASARRPSGAGTRPASGRPSAGRAARRRRARPRRRAALATRPTRSTSADGPTQSTTAPPSRTSGRHHSAAVGGWARAFATATPNVSARLLLRATPDHVEVRQLRRPALEERALAALRLEQRHLPHGQRGGEGDPRACRRPSRRRRPGRSRRRRAGHRGARRRAGRAEPRRDRRATSGPASRRPLRATARARAARRMVAR